MDRHASAPQIVAAGPVQVSERGFNAAQLEVTASEARGKQFGPCFRPAVPPLTHTDRFATRSQIGLARNHFLQFAGLVHLYHDVRPANKFALDVELGNGGPLAVFLDALANAVVLKHIDGFHGLGVYTARLQDLDGTAREAALGEAGVALHEEQNFVALDQLVDALLCVCHVLIPEKNSTQLSH